MKERNYFRFFPALVSKYGNFELACCVCMLLDFRSNKMINQAIDLYNGSLKTLYHELISVKENGTVNGKFYIKIDRKYWNDIEKIKDYVYEVLEKRYTELEVAEEN